MQIATTIGHGGEPAGGEASVRHYLPGGCENGGGIGRLVGYIESAARSAGKRHLVTDTRGRRWSFLGSPWRLLCALFTMAKDRFLAPERIHHIHVAGRGSTLRKLILTGAARSLGCPHLLHLHDYDYARDFSERSAHQQLRIRQMFQLADCVVVLGKRDQGTLVTMLGVDERRILLAPNSVPDPGPRDIREAEVPLILFLGRLSRRKGVDELLLALSHPAMERLRWRAVIAGDGPVNDYRRFAKEMGLAERVEMPGWLSSEATQILCAQADILVLPSYAEGMAMAVLEGLAHEAAVVTTRVGAHDEVISDGQTGLFVPVGDPDGLAVALEKLISDGALRRQLAAAGRAHYLAHFSMATYMEALERVYAAVSRRPQTVAGAR